MLIWCWGLTPLWFNITATILLFIRFSWRCILTVVKVFELSKDEEKNKG